MYRPELSVLGYAVYSVAATIVTQCGRNVSTTILKIVGESRLPWFILIVKMYRSGF